MKWNKRLVSTAALVLISVTSCSPNEPKKQLAAVNEENCKTENLKKMEDKETARNWRRSAFGTFKPSPRREW